MFKYIFVALVIILAFSLTGISCSLISPKSPSEQKAQQITTTPSTDLLTTASPEQFNSQAATNYNKAVELALSWQPDAVLYGLNIKLPTSLKANLATEIYLFGSPADQKVWYTVSINQQSGKITRAWVTKEDFMPQIQYPVKIQYWKTNYVEALQQAEKNQGLTFRDKNPNANISLTLAVSQPKNWLWWQVEYQATLSGETLKIKIDPNTGKVVGETGEPVGEQS